MQGILICKPYRLKVFCVMPCGGITSELGFVEGETHTPC